MSNIIFLIWIGNSKSNKVQPTVSVYVWLSPFLLFSLWCLS